ncbi:hypothetical protein ACH4S8_37425 [Streptomyces sp. NPDC021080]|uniref:hypothetical protein n=1 Tax=Streptomyces sp. NPDC021080 TaxID=3365110 RepID=UPI0037BA8A2B
MNVRLPDLQTALLCIWMVLTTGLVVNTRLEQRKEQAQKANRTPAPAVDPANPPTPGIFSYAPGATSLVRCYCHQHPIREGQPVICWPQPAEYTCADEETPK